MKDSTIAIGLASVPIAVLALMWMAGQVGAVYAPPESVQVVPPKCNDLDMKMLNDDCWVCWNGEWTEQDSHFCGMMVY